MKRTAILLLVLTAIAFAVLPLSAFAADRNTPAVINDNIGEVNGVYAVSDASDTAKAPIPVEEVADKEDGINLTAATTWIIIVSAVYISAAVALCVFLAKRSRLNNDETQ